MDTNCKNLSMKKYLFLIFGALFSFNSSAQTPVPYEYMVCEIGDSVLLQASDLYASDVIASIVNSGAVFDTLALGDDQLSPSINMGFGFDYYGVTHTNVRISSNVYLKFPDTPGEVETGIGYSPWVINAALPNGTATYNSILCPYTDVNPGISTFGIRYGTFGTSPNRVFVAIWPDMRMFGSCTDHCFANSVVLFEGSNKIRNYLGNYEFCAGWNSGAGVQGLINDDGTSSIFIEDPVLNLPRNYPLQWTAVNEMVEYTPNATGTGYTYQFLPFSPVGYITWVDQAGNIMGAGYTLPFVVTPSNIDDLPLILDANFSSCSESGNVAQAVITYGSQDISPFEEGPDCVDDANGNILFFTEGGENVDWDIDLFDASNNLINSYNGSNMPVNFTDLPVGDYRVVSISPTTCEYETEVTLVEKFHDVEFHAEVNDVLCNGDASGIIRLFPNGGLGEGWNLVVRDGLGNIVEVLNFDSDYIDITELSRGDYTFEMQSPTTCFTETSFTMNEPELLVFDREEFDHSYCDVQPAYVHFSARGGVEPYSYFFDGKEKLDLFEGIVDAGIHNVSIVDNNGCAIERRIEIFDNWTPKAYFEIDFEEINLDDATIHFTDATISNEHSVINKWEWYFGDGGKSFSQNPSHTYTDIGEYIVTLRIYDENNCFAEVERKVNIIDPVMVFPTVFSPNGDGFNEFYKPVYSRIQQEGYSLVIFDRWGKEVFSTEEIEEGWGGFIKDGKEAIPGTYVFHAEYKDDFGHESTKEGFFQLMR